MPVEVMSVRYNLAHPFHLNSNRRPKNVALVLEGTSYTYEELAALVRPLAGWLHERFPSRTPAVGILSNRSLEAYVGLLAAAWAGMTYVPLNPEFPRAYLEDLAKRAGIGVLVTDKASLPLLDSPYFSRRTVAILSPFGSTSRLTGGRIIHAREEVLESPSPRSPAAVSPEDYAYLMFTSGSTGRPKGVAATLGNVAHFLAATQSRYRLRSQDRLSQFNDLCWDPSVFDLFSAWKVGASVHVLPRRLLLFPAPFIRSHELSVWYSVPFQIEMMSRMGMLRSGNFPSLRLSLFVGEPLTGKAAAAWQRAAPRSLVENVYGPTETTVVCTGQVFDGTPDCLTPERGYVSIGKPYRGMQLGVLDARGRFLPPGVTGELAISGPQVTPGYWKSPGLTSRKFQLLDHPQLGESVWYRTGDQGYQDESGSFHFLGRLDNQVKVLGKRVELEEVEHGLRKASGRDEVCVLPWPLTDGSAASLVGFVGGGLADSRQLRTALEQILPPYMIPRSIRFLEALPRTRNGKIDRKRLLGMLASEATS